MINVKTREQLREAIKNKESTILITDEELALKVKKAKTIRKWSKRAIVASLAIFGVATLGIWIASMISMGVIGAGGGILLSTGAGTTPGIPPGAALGGGSIIGAIATSLWKDYEMEEFSLNTKYLKLVIKPKKP